MNDEDKKIYHGYLYLTRQSILLLHELGYDLFGFYVSLVMIARWHRANKNFSQIPLTQAEIAKKLKLTQSSVSRKLKALEKIKYCIIRHKNYIVLGYFSLFTKEIAQKIHSKDYANLHELYTDMHTINAGLQENYAKMQQQRAQNATQRLNSSSKDINNSFTYDLEELMEEMG